MSSIMSQSVPASRPGSGSPAVQLAPLSKSRPATPPQAPSVGGSGPRGIRISRRQSLDAVPQVAPLAVTFPDEASSSGGRQPGRRAKSMGEIPVMPTGGSPALLSGSPASGSGGEPLARALPRRASLGKSPLGEDGARRLPPLAPAPSPGKRKRASGGFYGESSAFGIPSWDAGGSSSDAARSAWSGAELLIPPSPDARHGSTTRTQPANLANLLPSPAVGFGHPSDPSDPAAIPAIEPSPFSPTKKLRASMGGMRLRSARGEGPAAGGAGFLQTVSEAPPPKPLGVAGGELLPAQHHRIKMAIGLWEVHTSMGGTIGAPWKALLRREFAALRDGERAEIEQAVAHHVKQSNFKKRVDERAWTNEEKEKLVNLFHIIDADEGGSISRHEFLEIASLAELGRAELGRVFDQHVLADRRRTARTPGGTIELTLAQFTRLIENLDDAMLSKVRACLHGLVEKRSGRESLLVFDDGKQQLWRLVPGGRTLVRKPKNTEAGGALNTIDSMVM